MADPNSYRRRAFPARPWITGALYDQYSSKHILHLDAYLLRDTYNGYLLVEWREGGLKLIARDTWLIEADGLTSVWDVPASGERAYWSLANHAVVSRVHQTVLKLPAHMLALGNWSRVVTLAHYVSGTRERPCDVAGNTYTAPKPYNVRAKPLPDIL